MSTPAGIHRHYQDKIADIENVEDRLHWGTGVYRDAVGDAELLNAQEGSMEMGTRLLMDDDSIGTGILKSTEMLLRLNDHKMHIKKELRGRAGDPNNVVTECNWRHEGAIHDVDMEPVGSRSLDRSDLVTEVAKVSRQDGGCYDD